MADYQFNTDLGPKGQQGTNIADMVTLARGVQAYQQAQELNPLAIKKAKEELSQAQIGTQEKQLGFTDKQQQLIFDELGTLKTDKRWLNVAKDKDGALEALMEREDRLRTKGIDPILLRKASLPMYDIIEKKPNLAGQVVENIIQRGGNEKQFSQLNQAPQFVNTGAGIVPVYTSQFQGGGPGKTPTLGQYLAPTVATSETGAPMIIGGGKGGGGNLAPQQNVTEPVVPIGTQKTPSNVQGATTPNITTSFAEKGGIQRSTDETYEAYKERVGRLTKLPTVANNAMNMANIDSIPRQEYVNNQIIKLLENKDVRVGKIAEAVANKTGGIGLSPEEQEVQKYLEQRIRQESARSNQDQASQRSAYGSFGTDKKALLNIIYNDKANLAAQRLFNQGVLKAQGNPNKPNLAAVNEFENKFNTLNQDPEVMQLIGVVGNKSMEDLSKSDKQHLAKYFSGMSQEKINELFARKEALEKLVRGEK